MGSEPQARLHDLLDEECYFYFDKGKMQYFTCVSIWSKGKGKGDYRYSSTLSLTSALDGVGGQRHGPAALPTGITRYPVYRGGVGPRVGLNWCCKTSSHRDSIPGPPSP
jgi:hypothetical protein